MTSILIQNVRVDQDIRDIAIQDNIITAIEPHIDGQFDDILDATGLLASPAFYNTHCHAAMTIFRGMADQLQLFDWLQNHIWPAEAKLNDEHIYWFSKLAFLEMIKSGTVFVNDMYFFPLQTIMAAEEMGIRAAIGMSFCDGISPEMQARAKIHNDEIIEREKDFSSRIQLTLAPHAVYTITEQTFRMIEKLAKEHNWRVHIHVSETQGEVDDCRKQHNNMTPVQYLDQLGILTPNTIAAHSIHLTDEDIDILAKRQVVLSHNPCSNFKLNSGSFRFRDTIDAGCQVTIGTDGCASNDSLSMFDDMKTAVFNARLQQNSAVAAGASEVFNAATLAPAKAFNINAGEIKPGKIADLMLIDTNKPQMISEYDWRANLVYAADSSCVHSVICDGRFIMKNRAVPGEEEIISRCKDTFANFKKLL